MREDKTTETSELASDEDAMTLAEAARHLRISADSLIRRAKSGAFKWSTAAGAMVFSRSDLDAHLERRVAEDQGHSQCAFCGSFAAVYGSRYQLARRDALQRSNSVCQLCGLHEATEAHHWADPQQYPCDNCIASTDLTALCKVCHDIATELRSLHYSTNEELILGTSKQWAGEDSSLPMIFRYASQSSTRRGNLSVAQWIDHNWRRIMATGADKPVRPKLEVEQSNGEPAKTTIEMDLSFAIRLQESLAEQAEYQALLDGVGLGEWLQNLVAKGLGNGKGVGPWLEELIDEALQANDAWRQMELERNNRRD